MGSSVTIGGQTLPNLLWRFQPFARAKKEEESLFVKNILDICVSIYVPMQLSGSTITTILFVIKDINYMFIGFLTI